MLLGSLSDGTGADKETRIFSQTKDRSAWDGTIQTSGKEDLKAYGVGENTRGLCGSPHCGLTAWEHKTAVWEV
jgi:hypothetical protein